MLDTAPLPGTAVLFDPVVPPRVDGQCVEGSESVRALVTGEGQVDLHIRLGFTRLLQVFVELYLRRESSSTVALEGLPVSCVNPTALPLARTALLLRREVFIFRVGKLRPLSFKRSWLTQLRQNFTTNRQQMKDASILSFH